MAIGIAQVADNSHSHRTMDGSLFRWLSAVARFNRVVIRVEESEEEESGQDRKLSRLVNTN